MNPGLIQNPVVQERLLRFTGTKQGSIAPTLAPELVPIVIVDDLSRTGKGGAISTVRPWIARAGLTAVNFAYVRLVNLSTEVVLRVRQLTLCSQAFNQPVYMQLVKTVVSGLLVATQKAYVDGRLLGTPVADLRTLDGVAGPVLADQHYESRLVSGGPTVITFQNPIVLDTFAPAQAGHVNGLVISLNTAGTTLQVTVEGEEEPAIG